MTWKKLMGGMFVLVVSCGAACAQGLEESTVEAANDVMREIMEIPIKGIPASLLADAHGVTIIPGMIKGGFVIGVRHGKGVILVRNATGEWAAPVFVTVTGGSIGFQAGLQSTDVVAVFKNRRGIDRLMHGKLTIGADAAVAAGPIGREATAATDAQLRAEILSYSRSRGLFAGVAIDGAVLQIDHRATDLYYAPKPGQPRGTVPASAVKLVEQIVAYAGPKRAAVTVLEAPMVPQPTQAAEVEAVRAQLVDSALRLQRILDPQWNEFLALPAEAYVSAKPPARNVLTRCLDRYNIVTNDARYQNLSSRPEFRETHALLIRYHTVLEGNKSSTVNLPPPPPN